MTQSTYVVRLIDCDGSLSAHRQGVLTLMQSWYRSLAQAASSNTATWSADVDWLTQPPANRPTQDAGSPLSVNMLLFYLPDSDKSVIKLHDNWRRQNLPADSDSGIKGTTVLHWRPQGAAPDARNAVVGISEIYVSRNSGANATETQLNLARIGFHESMHDQMVRVEAELHNMPAGGFAAAVPTGAAPNARNLANMAATLSRLTPQWLDGFAAWRQAAIDPLGFL